VLPAIAAKGAKELAYHRDYAAGWVIRLGDGTEFSHAKTQAALEKIWPLAAELNVAPQAGAVLDAVFSAATLTRPSAAAIGAVAGKTGRDGAHTEAMGYILAELQSLARAHREARW
jgi:ring-1,2-phenylacetyl-CoA epoxidase subunit PaaC